MDMKCQGCGADTEVVKTTIVEGTRERLRVCANDHRAVTVEVWKTATGNEITVVPRLPATPPATNNLAQKVTGNREVTGNATGNPEGGGGVFRSGLVSSSVLSDPDPSVERKQVRAVRGTAIGYPQPFEEFWALCDDGGRGKGNKYPAFKAWRKNNLDPKITSVIWNRWMTTPAWLDGYNPDVSTWLNQRGFEREPSEVELRPRGKGLPEKAQRGREAWREALKGGANQ